MERASDTIILAEKTKNDETLIPMYLKRMEPLVRSVTKKYLSYSGYEVYKDDIISVAQYGLCKAVKSFDFSRHGFFSYSKKAMEIEIRLFLSNESRMIRLPRYITSLNKRINDEKKSSSESKTDSQIMKSVKIKSTKTYKTVKDAQKYSVVYSLDTPLTEDNKTAEEIFASSVDIENDYIESENQSAIKRAVMSLSAEEKYIIVHSFGLFDNPPMKNKDMAKKFGVTTVTIINKRKRALSILEEKLSPLYY